MLRLTAVAFLVLASLVAPMSRGQDRPIPPAFSAEPAPGTTADADIDPATGLARTTVVRPLRDAPLVPEPRRAETPRVKRPHIALILPTLSPALGKLADAVRQGFVIAAEAAGREAAPVHVTAIESETQSLVESCRAAAATGALVIVGGLTRDGAAGLDAPECTRQPALALNEVRAANPALFSISLSLEHEARQAALLAVEAGLRQAIVIHGPSPITRRVQEAFEREWTRAAGEVRRIPFSGSPEEAPAIRERIAAMRGDMVFLALDHGEALAVRPYISAMLPVYATSLSVNPRAEPLVNLDLQGVRYMEMPWFIHPDHPAVMVYPGAKGVANVDQERLYALGIDAFRLALLLARGEGGRAVLDGVTGRIAADPGNHFARQLSAAEIDGGRVIPLRPQ